MTVQELKKIVDRLVNSGRGEYAAITEYDSWISPLEEDDDVLVNDEDKTVRLG